MSSNYSVSSTTTLSNGLPIPLIHLGVYESEGPACVSAVVSALTLGYRGIDSAEWYENESLCGDGIRSFLSSHPQHSREEIFYTTKLRDNGGYEHTKQAIRKSLSECGLGYIDMYLLHAPYGGKQVRRECWRAVEEAVKEGLVRTAGVSNFGVGHLRELIAAPDLALRPAVNQIELHPFNTQREIVEFCRAEGIVIEAYSPLVRGLRFEHPVIVELSKKYGCSPAQLLVRWGLQNGFVVLPKSTKQERIKENAEVAGFEISQEDMDRLANCHEKLVTDWDPTDCE
ncbi:NADP-dependent oxidoreductase domain-containing protein [Tricharina praecox]|uniref:NADP-dependent oxidoreductase domain-containing protein n=1 Tax=Tricharina praecox TaxID=43433 RepID=UPI0022204C37|nr:NADP-dependent oxidoreductase domain-containing protein [Tricharina praecox]KAI5857247.1 NADP-dependent oxidoreductase domain-containing protein [Tricharina praecox]